MLDCYLWEKEKYFLNKILYMFFKLCVHLGIYHLKGFFYLYGQLIEVTPAGTVEVLLI